MKKQPLLSVIIPVYKVERYLEDCIESILNQSYNNLELILVNDGSPDKCPEICDSYKVKDQRVVVLHQVNQGLSQARNAGLNKAKGDYITFVDSDDWVYKDAYTNMMNKILEENADIVTCGVHSFIDGKSVIYEHKRLNVHIFTTTEVLKRYLYEKYGIYVIACNKIYNKRIFKTLSFPKDRLFEDFVTITKAFINAKKILVIDNDYYFYRKRIDSINGSHFNNQHFNDRIMDLADAVDQVFDIIKDYDHSLLEYIIPAGLKSKLSVANQMLCSRRIDAKFIKKLQKEISYYRNYIFKCEALEISEKIKLLLFTNMKLYRVIYKVYIKIQLFKA